MARHEDDYRSRSHSPREEYGPHRDSMRGNGRRGSSHDEDDRRRHGSGNDGSYGSGRYGSKHDHDGSYGGYGSSSRDREGRYGEADYGGGSSYRRGNYENDEMGAGGGRGSGYGSGYGEDVYRGRGGTPGDVSSQMGGSHSQGMRRHDTGGSYGGSQHRGGGYAGWSDNSRGGQGGGYGSEHAGMGGGYGIGASGQEQHHRGKGPKGYARSDDRIKEDVCDCLSDDPMIDAGEIEVQVKQGEVTLSGTVSDRLAKRHAEDMIERLSGVKHVQNNIRVKDRSSGDQTGAQSGKSGKQA